MNCTIIEKLLPLYVEGDLAEREMANVRAHLSSCDYCRSVAEEFSASQSRLHNFAVPEFGAEFYEQIRSTVLMEINSRPVSRPSFFQTLRPFFTFFTWRPAAAFSFALLVLFGALSFGLYRSLIKRDAPLLVIEKNMGEFSLDEISEAAGQSRQEDSVNGNGSSIVRQSGVTAQNNIARQKLRPVGQGKERPENSIHQSTDAASSSVAEQTQEDGMAGNVAPAQAVARMDIQTSDPNIRIIWLGRKPSE
jgi:hypothetical protein